MKLRIKPILTVLLALFIFNCEEDTVIDDQITADSLIGTWQMTSYINYLSLTTNETVTVEYEESPGTGSINLTGDITASLNYLDIDEYGGFIYISIKWLG